MAIITSHFLNGIDGTHAGNVAASLLRIDADGTRKLLQECLSGSDGRLQIDVDSTADPEGTQYELVIASGAYFAKRQSQTASMIIKREIVMRFDMPDPAAAGSGMSNRITISRLMIMLAVWDWRLAK